MLDVGAPLIHVAEIQESQITVDQIKEKYLSADYNDFENEYYYLF